MSSMLAPQKLREMQACIAKLLPQQRICHPEEPPSLTRKNESVDPPRALQRRSGKNFSQDRGGELFFSDLLQFRTTDKHPPQGNTGTFLFNSSSGVLEEENTWLEAWPLQLSVEEYPLVWKHKDLVTVEQAVTGLRAETEDWGSSSGRFLHYLDRKSRKRSPTVFTSHLFLYMQICLISPPRSKHANTLRDVTNKIPLVLRCESLAVGEFMS